MCGLCPRANTASVIIEELLLRTHAREEVIATDMILKLGPVDHGRTMTLEEFLKAEVQEGFRYELARGVELTGWSSCSATDSARRVEALFGLGAGAGPAVPGACEV
jgi:hypothetical protein